MRDEKLNLDAIERESQDSATALWAAAKVPALCKRIRELEAKLANYPAMKSEVDLAYDQRRRAIARADDLQERLGYSVSAVDNLQRACDAALARVRELEGRLANLEIPGLDGHQALHANLAAAIARAEQAQHQVAELAQAVVLATTAVPSMVMDPADPVGMMQRVVARVRELARSREGWRADAEREAGNVLYWRARAEQAERALPPEPCTICDLPIRGGAFIGDGDGTGSRFAHAHCYRTRAELAALRTFAKHVIDDAPVTELFIEEMHGEGLREVSTGEWVCNGCGGRAESEDVEHHPTCLRALAFDALKAARDA